MTSTFHGTVAVARGASRLPTGGRDASERDVSPLSLALSPSRGRGDPFEAQRCSARGASSLPTGGREEVRAAGAAAQRGIRAAVEAASARAAVRCAVRRRSLASEGDAPLSLPSPPQGGEGIP